MTTLLLSDNQITAVSPLAELKNLIRLELRRNAIRDVAPLAGLKNLRILSLDSNQITDIGPLANLTLLGNLSLRDNEISDLASLVGLKNLESVTVRGNALSYSSIHTHIPVLQERGIEVSFDHRTPHRIRIVSGDDQQGLAGMALAKPFVVKVQDENEVVFEGVPIMFTVTGGGGTLSETTTTTDSNGWADSILTLGPEAGANTVSVSAAGSDAPVTFHAISEIRIEYLLSLPTGISLIHVPLKVTAVDGAEQTIESIADLYDVLGGASTVNFLITHDSSIQEWFSYFVPSDKGTPADRGLTDDMGTIAGMKAPTSVRLTGSPLGTDGSSTITLNSGLNLVGLPLRDSRINRVSDLFALGGISGNVPVIILTDGGEFKLVGRAGDPGDIEITGGQAFLITASQDATVAISGDAWANGSGAAAPPIALKGIEVGNTTPVLGLRGAIVDEETGLKAEGFRVTVKNLSTGRAFATVDAPNAAGYRSTVVDIETDALLRLGISLKFLVNLPTRRSV